MFIEVIKKYLSYTTQKKKIFGLKSKLVRNKKSTELNRYIFNCEYFIVVTVLTMRDKLLYKFVHTASFLGFGRCIYENCMSCR